MAEKYFEVDEVCGEFIVRFDLIFDNPDLAVYNKFRLGIKRNFVNEITRVLETWNTILLNEDSEFNDAGAYFIMHLLDAKSKIMTSNSMSFEELFYYIDKMIDPKKIIDLEKYNSLDEKTKTRYEQVGNYYQLIKYKPNKNQTLLVDAISNYIDSVYVNMDQSDTEKYKKNKDIVQLVISDDQAKAISAVAYIHRLLIPLTAEYMQLFKVSSNESEEDEDLNNEDICNKIFDHLIDCVSSEPKRIRNKLYKLVESRVNKMCFSAASFWDKAVDYGVTPSSFIDFIYKKVINSALHKMNILEDDFNIVSYLQSIINNQIAFKFGMKFADTYNYYNPASGQNFLRKKDNDKDLTLDKIESQLAQKDEGLLIIEQENKSVIDDLPRIFDVSAEDVEVEKMMNFIKINPIQEQICSNLTYKYFNSVDTIKTCSRREYAKILLCCSKYLAKNNFVILSKLLISNCLALIEKVSISGNKIKQKIESTKSYQSLINNKYASYRGEIEKPLQSLIATIRSSTFIDDNGNDVFENGVTLDEIANEVCDLVYLF